MKSTDEQLLDDLQGMVKELERKLENDMKVVRENQKTARNLCVMLALIKKNGSEIVLDESKELASHESIRRRVLSELKSKGLIK